MSLKASQIQGEGGKYEVSITGPRKLKGTLTAPIVLTTQAEWSDLMSSSDAASGASEPAEKAAQLGASAFGFSTVLSSATFQKFTGASPIVVSVQMSVLAWSDAQSEVLDKMKQALTFALPPQSSGTAGIFQPPAGDLAGAVAGQLSGSGGAGNDDLYFTVKTSYLFIPRLLPETAIMEPEMTLHHSGKPIAGKITATFKTYKAMTRSEVENWFG